MIYTISITFTMKRILVVLLLTCITTVHFGQQFKFWERLKGPTGGYVYTVSVDSTQRVIIGTGAAGIFTSTNNGDTWNPLNKGLRALQMKRVESGPDGYIYMYNHINDFARFHDIDIGWEYLDPWEIDGVPNIEDVHVSKNGTIYISAFKQGVRRSTDHGNSWEWTNWFTEDSARKKFTFRRLAATMSGDTIYALNDSGYVFRTTDEGVSWIMSTGQQPKPRVMAESFEVSRGGDLIIATQRDIPGGKFYRSTDQGNSWTLVFSHPFDHVAYSLVRSNANGDMYATTHSPADSKDQTNLGGIYRSTDNGLTWVVRDESEHGDDKFSMAVNKYGEIFHGSVPGGVEKSTDRGFTWFKKNDGLFVQFLLGTAVNSQGHLFALTAFTLYRSTNGGDQWKEIPIEQVESSLEPLIRMSNNDVLYHGSFFGLYRSSDNGDHWDHVLDGDSADPSNHFFDLQTAPNGWVFASSVKTGLMMSKNNGVGGSWEPVPNLPPNVKIFSITFAAPDTVYLATDISTCLRSTNFGVNWSQHSSGIPAAKLMVHHPNGAVFAQLAHVVKMLPPGSTTWEQVFPTTALDTIHTWEMYSIFRDRNNNILVTTDSGIWRSAAPFTQWEQIGFGTTTPDYRIDHYCNISQIVQNEATGILYASSRGQSMFRSKFPDAGVKLSSYVALPGGVNYPNPFTDHTTLEVPITKQGVATLELYTALGEQIYQERIGTVVEGTYPIPIDGSQFASGSYMYVVRVDAVPIAKGWMQIVR